MRLLLGLTQKALGEKFGVTLDTISRWERGFLKLPKMAALAIRHLRTEQRRAGRGSEE